MITDPSQTTGPYNGTLADAARRFADAGRRMRYALPHINSERVEPKPDVKVRGLRRLTSKARTRRTR